MSSYIGLYASGAGPGADKIGIYRSSNRRFYLNADGDLTWSAGDLWAAFGISGDLPIRGDWNGDGTDEIGVYRPANRRFYLDQDGSLGWSTGDVFATFGSAGDEPVTGKW